MANRQVKDLTGTCLSNSVPLPSVCSNSLSLNTLQKMRAAKGEHAPYIKN